MSTKVQRRHVIYLSGFDPRGASFYHRIYRTDSQRQAEINGMTFSVGRRHKCSPVSHHWDIQSTSGEHETFTRYEFMAWDDIVRAHWPQGYAALLLATLKANLAYVPSGTLAKVGRTSRPPFITGLYPLSFMPTALLLGAGITWGVSALSMGLAGLVPAVLMGLGAGAATLALTQRLGERINVFWLLRLYAFAAHWVRDGVPELEQRLDRFAERVQSALDDSSNDEVLIVGHSVGAILAMSVTARVLKAGSAENRTENRLSLLTMGECIPLVSFLPGATDYRNDLERVGNSHERYWADFTAAMDGACFPLVNPVTASGLTQAEGTAPHILSTRFHTLFTPEHYRRIRRNWYRMHFQYIMSTDQQGLFDYFAITAGAEKLEERLAHD
ncbi:MAG: hypothetical protein B7Y40_06865 [Gammaproteobacteria bacterium 28-57-27]|nr:MAG: hypothetical protein B7Y40_06865 [Gammaproteobacteria bacterium 28-57-27]